MSVLSANHESAIVMMMKKTLFTITAIILLAAPAARATTEEGDEDGVVVDLLFEQPVVETEPRAPKAVPVFNVPVAFCFVASSNVTEESFNRFMEKSLPGNVKIVAKDEAILLFLLNSSSDFFTNAVIMRGPNDKIHYLGTSVTAHGSFKTRLKAIAGDIADWIEAFSQENARAWAKFQEN